MPLFPISGVAQLFWPKRRNALKKQAIFGRNIKPGATKSWHSSSFSPLSMITPVWLSGADREIETFCVREGGEQDFLRAEQMPEFNLSVNNTARTAL